MKEVALMDPSKETENKLRWRSDIEGVEFKLYVPKWRVPRPWPIRIIVAISDVLANSDSPRDVRLLNSRPEVNGLERPIVAVVGKVRQHTETVRFAPLGDPKGWEIGEPYVPYSLLSDPCPQQIRIEVRWDRSAGTWSDD